MTETERPTFGIGLRILSGFLMAGMFVSVKAVSGDVPLGEIVFFRSFFAILPLIIFLWVRGEFPGGLATNAPSITCCGQVSARLHSLHLSRLWRVLTLLRPF